MEDKDSNFDLEEELRKLHDENAKAENESSQQEKSGKHEETGGEYKNMHNLLYRAILCLDSITDPDAIDGVGFNKRDAEFGQQLAELIRSGRGLSLDLQRAALKMLKKYIRQLLAIGIDVGKITIDEKMEEPGGEEAQQDGEKGTFQAEVDEYFVDDLGSLRRWRNTSDGRISIKLANFDVRIVEEIAEDNGLEITHSYGIEGKIKDRLLPKIEVPASSFPSLNWLHKWGNQVILEPGYTTKDYVRHAIQVRSDSVKQLMYYTHTGWRRINNKWVYLHAGGAIGAENVFVRLPRELQRYSLPIRPENETEAIKASLSFLDIGKCRVTLPLFSFLYLSPLTSVLKPLPNFSGDILGETGLFKTTIAALLASHFGDFTTISQLSNFEDTANAIERRAFTLKDCLMILDDYHPLVRKMDAQQAENKAQRIIRAYANRTGRGRLNPDASEKGRYEPRGMLLITGEEIVSLQSTQARLMIIEISKGDINVAELSELQAKASLLPHAMCSYILWIGEHIEEIVRIFPKHFLELRTKALKGSHRKLCEQVAFLQFALDTTLSWLVDKGILSETEAVPISKEGWDTFIKLAQKQTQRLELEDPVILFKDILHTLITQGQVRIEDKTTAEIVKGNKDGDLIGYCDDSYVYLLGSALWHSIQRYLIVEGSHFPFSKYTLYGILRRRGLIETKGSRNLIDVKIRGETRKVLKFLWHHILENEATEATEPEDA